MNRPDPLDQTWLTECEPARGDVIAQAWHGVRFSSPLLGPYPMANKILERFKFAPGPTSSLTSRPSASISASPAARKKRRAAGAAGGRGGISRPVAAAGLGEKGPPMDNNNNKKAPAREREPPRSREEKGKKRADSGSLCLLRPPLDSRANGGGSCPAAKFGAGRAHLHLGRELPIHGDRVAAGDEFAWRRSSCGGERRDERRGERREEGRKEGRKGGRKEKQGEAERSRDWDH